MSQHVKRGSIARNSRRQVALAACQKNLAKYKTMGKDYEGKVSLTMNEIEVLKDRCDNSKTVSE
jgi:hypothetical protein